MAVNKIIFDDKIKFQDSPLPEINKFTDNNVNEIKTIVNNNADELSLVLVSPVELVDWVNISFNFNNKFFDFKKLDTAETAITLTISNVIQGANQILSVKKTIAGDVIITLAGASFYGYNNLDLNTTPELLLSGNVNDVFDISFLARTNSEIGVAIGSKGN